MERQAQRDSKFPPNLSQIITSKEHGETTSERETEKCYRVGGNMPEVMEREVSTRRCRNTSMSQGIISPPFGLSVVCSSSSKDLLRDDAVQPQNRRDIRDKDGIISPYYSCASSTGNGTCLHPKHFTTSRYLNISANVIA